MDKKTFTPVNLDFWRDPDHGYLEIRRSAYQESAFIPHTHEAVSVALVAGGETRYMHLGTTRAAKAGDIVVIGPGEVHSCNMQPGEHMVYVMFSIDQEWWAGLARSLPTDFGDPVILPSLIQESLHFEALMQLFETLLTEPSRLERESLI
ncbi:MAG: hypothetical protein D6E12_15505, partial [Desulfovibrio sp.]